MNPLWVLRTARLVLTPVSGADLADLCAIKADPQMFAIMLGGVRSPEQTAEELADDVVGWGADGFGMWAIREAGQFLGITGLERRPDGRGVAREAAGAALRFGHEQARLPRIIAVARESNFASRMALGGIGMTECGDFVQFGYRMVMYESVTLPIRRIL